MPRMIPETDPAALEWMKFFAQAVTEDGMVYHVSAADALAVSDAVGRFAAAMGTATAMETRTRPAIADKDAALAISLQLCSEHAKFIKYNSSISDADKLAIGIKPVSAARRAVPKPSERVFVKAMVTGTNSVDVKLGRLEGGMRKPDGAANIMLWAAAGETEPAGRQWQLERLTGSTRLKLRFDGLPHGGTVWLMAQYVNARGQAGPFGPAVPVRIAGSGVLPRPALAEAA